MVGTPLITAWIGVVAFWCLVAWGMASAELSRRTVGVFLALWLLAYVGFDYLPVPYAAMFPAFVALLDVALVLIIFKGDLRIG
jgi:hypothetical protein